jgi:uncharacterized protein YdiU (UPF0061 family)
VLTRVAASHIRVGSFEFFASRGDTEALRLLLDEVITRHDPQARDASVPALAVLDAVADRQARLIAQWMHVGFIHGVMNTDNMALSGETIDYGPCAFMDEFDPRTVFSSIDRQGRYAFANQPAIAQWNLARLAESLLPLIDENRDKAVDQALEIIEPFIDRFDAHYLAGLRAKIGLASAEDGDRGLVKDLMQLMGNAAADHTLTFRELADAAAEPAQDVALLARFEAAPGIADWLAAWRSRLARDPQSPLARAVAMRGVNPAYVPRNHRVEAALTAATDDNDLRPFETLLEILRHPFEEQAQHRAFREPPADQERVLQTFCGT